ncbi:MAG: phosphatase PAP2 family protein [Actinomycetota bacterium]
MVRRAGSHRPPTFARLLGSWPVWLIALGFMLLAGLAGLADGTLLAWDLPLRDLIEGLFQGAGLEEFLRQIGKLGSRELIGLLTIPAAWIAWSRCRQLAYVLVGAFAAAFALEVVLKATIARPRPPPGIGFGDSFPSGHVLAAAAFWGLMPAWVYLVTGRRWAWAAALVGTGVILLGVGVSRVFLGAHWPSDVVGGYLGGAIFLLIAEWMIHRPVLRCTECPLHPIRHPRVPVRQ